MKTAITLCFLFSCVSLLNAYPQTEITLQRSRRDIFDFFGGVAEAAGDVVSGVGSVVAEFVNPTDSENVTTIATSSVTELIDEESTTVISADNNPDVFGDFLTGVGDTVNAITAGAGDAVNIVSSQVGNALNNVNAIVAGSLSDGLDSWEIIQNVIGIIAAIENIFIALNFVNVLIYWAQILSNVVGGIANLSIGNILGAALNFVTVVSSLAAYPF